jgi:hypothetical protein
MTYRAFVFLLLGFFILTSGCKGGLLNDFKSLDDLVVPPHKSKLVVFANLKANYDFNKVYVYKSSGSLDTSNGFFFRNDSIFRDSMWYVFGIIGVDTVNATVELFRNGQLIESVKQDYGGNLNRYELNRILKADGATYKLRVSAAGFETVETEQVMPNLIKLDSVKLLRKGLVVSGTYYFPKAYELIAFFKDSLTNTPNYYFISPRYVSFDSQLFNLDPSVNGNVLTDKNIDGKSFAWHTFYRNLSWAELTHMRLDLHNTTRDAYLFEQSSRRYLETKNNRFAEPTTLYSNIKNGYGIFTLSAVSEFYLQF